MTAEYITLGLYFIILILLGAVFSRQNKNLSDYIRGGAQGAWWLVGASTLMSAISAFTFTGNASAAFDAGPTMLVIYFANCAGFFVAWLWVAARFRRTRAFTLPDIIRARFGTGIEQFNVYVGLLLGPIGAAIQLWALAVFASSAFNLPIQLTIIIIGCVTVFYSTTGGRWAVMATDFVQGLVLIPLSILVAVLALIHIGGIGEFFSFFSDPRFAADFQFVKEPGQFSDNKFGWQWIIVIFIMQFIGYIGAAGAQPFFVAKDEKEASRAALLAMVLMAVGTAIWFIPPMVARFMFESDIRGLGVDDPASSSYAFIAGKLLPQGMMGIMIAAMFSATMSSMDTGLNRQAGIIARNLVPRLRGAMGKPELSDKTNMIMVKSVTVGLGVILVGYALLLSQQKSFSLFDAYLTMGSIIGMPLALPMIVSIYIKKLPKWSFFFMFGTSLVPVIWSLLDAKFNGNSWTIQERTMWVFIAFTLSVAISRPFYRFSGARYKAMVEEFFTTMHTPIDYLKEVGVAKDYDQLRLMGNTCLAAAGMLCLLFIGVLELWEAACVLFMITFVAAVGLLLKKGARIEMRKTRALEEEAARRGDVLPTPDA